MISRTSKIIAPSVPQDSLIPCVPYAFISLSISGTSTSFLFFLLFLHLSVHSRSSCLFSSQTAVVVSPVLLDCAINSAWCDHSCLSPVLHPIVFTMAWIQLLSPFPALSYCCLLSVDPVIQTKLPRDFHNCLLPQMTLSLFRKWYSPKLGISFHFGCLSFMLSSALFIYQLYFLFIDKVSLSCLQFWTLYKSSFLSQHLVIAHHSVGVFPALYLFFPICIWVIFLLRLTSLIILIESLEHNFCLKHIFFSVILIYLFYSQIFKPKFISFILICRNN